MWLAFRQGRWVLAACLAGALLLGFTVHLAPLSLWPLGSLVLGLVCGLAAFVPDQREGHRFLGAQRFPPGTVWAVKLLFWGSALLGLAALAWSVDRAGGIVLFPVSGLQSSELRGYRWYDELGDRAELVSPVVYRQIVNEVWRDGWPAQSAELARWLDRMFEGEWAAEARRATELPPGLVLDPRLRSRSSYDRDVQQGCQDLAALFTARALQLQARGDSRAALGQLETVLALSRQVRNHAPPDALDDGYLMEAVALTGVHLWLQKLGPDRELLRSALAVLQQHEADVPDPADAVKAEFLVYRNTDHSPAAGTPLVRELLTGARQAPWERERQRRIEKPS